MEAGRMKLDVTEINFLNISEMPIKNPGDVFSGI